MGFVIEIKQGGLFQGKEDLLWEVSKPVCTPPMVYEIAASPAHAQMDEEFKDVYQADKKNTAFVSGFDF
jgi:hypothetical protein